MRGAEGTLHAIVSKKKKKKREGSKITFTFTKCFRLFTQHLSSSLCHRSGTKELARQTMLLRQKRVEKRRIEQREEKREMTQVRAQVVAKAPGGIRVVVLVI